MNKVVISSKVNEMVNRVVKLFLGVSFSLFFTITAQANPQQLLQLIDYLGVDYAGAVQQGKVVNIEEYNEMLDFSKAINEQIKQLPETEANRYYKAQLLNDAQALSAYVIAKASAQIIQQVTAKMRNTLVAGFNIQIMPTKLPDLAKAENLYKNNCASCHGLQGYGDGIAAKTLTPKPTDFYDKARYRQRTLYSLYSTITEGVSGTAMPSFQHLNEQERWSLAFYVGAKAIEKPVNFSINKEQIDLSTFTNLTPNEAQQKYGRAGTEAMAWLRHNPDVLFNTKNPLAFAKKQLTKVLAAYQLQQYQQAYKLAVEAYLEGFELVENNLQSINKPLKQRIERDMTTLRTIIREQQPLANIKVQIQLINAELDSAISVLKSTSLSPQASFLSALFILLREGLEALLLVAAIAAFLIRTNRRDALRYVHFGWIGALALGGLTWWASQTVINISGASREVTEGVAALTAAIVLLYVGIWMHNKTSAANWQKFIATNVKEALSKGTLWGISVLSFIAVYREVFETILFYQALWAQTNEAGQNMALMGIVVATLCLVALAWAILRYSKVLPLRQFFALSGGLMFILAIVFAGKGIAALIEAGWLINYPVNFYQIDLLGIYPNAIGLSVQSVLVLLALYLLKNVISTKNTSKINQ
jgi:high-affinity iron transporter